MPPVRLILLLIFLMSGRANAETVHAAVASNFALPIQEIGRLFEQATGHRLLVSTGSSGKLFAQIRNGAPFHVFLSADQEKPQTLEALGETVPGSRFTYATGRLALWSPLPAFQSSDERHLRANKFRRLALANPELAPYGYAALQTIDKLGLRGAIEPKWVRGENIAQTFQFVASGNAELGFVALSQIIGLPEFNPEHSWIVPADHYAPIHQDAVQLKRAGIHEAASAFMTFLRQTSTAKVIESFGYLPADSSSVPTP